MKKPSYEFKFNLTHIDSDLKRKANLRLVELLTLAPPGARAFGVMNKDGPHYISAIEVSSPYRCFFQKAVGLTPASALSRVLERVEDALYRWRYGGGNHGEEFQSDTGPMNKGVA
ncbi:hypothetical protein K2X30_12270 [bacterium]|jgi:hypothetical protein|nr:hypothetical protein [bacterium]